jgi:uncharacterized secreted repeat protein (TIGR03808 family)
MNRRAFLSGTFGLAALTPATAAANVDPGAPALWGTFAPGPEGLRPNVLVDQGPILQRLLEEAAAEDRPVILPPGRFIVSNVKLPARTRIMGTAGATRLILGERGSLITAEGAEIVVLNGLVLDGTGGRLDDYIPGLVHLAGCANVGIENCEIVGSPASGIALDRSGGRISHSRVTNAALAGIRAIESTGLSIADNLVEDCGNGGILVWRWSEGEDGTIVSGNRVARIAANDGGTGENGNAINVFRAHGCVVSNNHISDCAFTAVRANSANNVQILGNNCRGLGEVAIFCEFSFAGSVIANNIIDQAGSGISVSNFREGGRIAVVANNVVRDLTGIGPLPKDAAELGVGIAVEADVALTGNIIDGAPRYGMVLGWGPYLRDVAATGNVIRRAPVGIAVSVVEGAGAAVISDNLISGATSAAIRGMRWSEPATDDLTVSGAAAYPHLSVERNRVS